MRWQQFFLCSHPLQFKIEDSDDLFLDERQVSCGREPPTMTWRSTAWNTWRGWDHLTTLALFWWNWRSSKFFCTCNSIFLLYFVSFIVWPFMLRTEMTLFLFVCFVLFFRALALIDSHGGNPYLTSLIKELSKLYTKRGVTHPVGAEGDTSPNGPTPSQSQHSAS